MLKPIIRYPGGKRRLRVPILAKLARYENWAEFREPFVGSGAITIEMINAHPERDCWINDLDIGIYCMWKSLRDNPELLARRVRDFVPTMEAYTQIRAYLRSRPIGACDHDVVHIGFCKIAIHCMSFSGIGVAGGPLLKIDQKWSPVHLCENIARLRHYVRHIKITKTDYGELITDESVPCLLYLDPPYWAGGVGLYAHFFRPRDHVDLARRLRSTPHSWVLSYDDCPQIRNLYEDWADIASIPAKYTIKSAPVITTELLISSKLPAKGAG